MKIRLFAALLVIAGLTVSAPAKAITIDAALTTADHLATDDTTNHFRYDLYKITNTSLFDLTLRITMDPGDDLKPWLGYTYNLGVLPSSNWDSGSPTPYEAMEIQSSSDSNQTIGFDGVWSTPVNDFSAGASLLLAVSTFDYIEDVDFLFDVYTLTITGDIIPVCEFDCGPGDQVVVGQDRVLLVEQILPAAVPAPFTPALLFVGLAGLALTRRRANA